jgi:hypothetical protein
LTLTVYMHVLFRPQVTKFRMGFTKLLTQSLNVFRNFEPKNLDIIIIYKADINKS